MDFEQELEYEQDHPYGDDEGTGQYPTDEEDSNWPPHFCGGCGFAILDCVCADDDECRTCGNDVVDCACSVERRRRREERIAYERGWVIARAAG